MGKLYRRNSTTGFTSHKIEKDFAKGEDYRKIILTPYGERYDYIKELKL